MMSEDLDQTAAAYALGILRGAPRAAIEAEVADQLADWDNQMWVKSAVDSFHGERSG